MRERGRMIEIIQADAAVRAVTEADRADLRQMEKRLRGIRDCLFERRRNVLAGTEVTSC